MHRRNHQALPVKIPTGKPTKNLSQELRQTCQTQLVKKIPNWSKQFFKVNFVYCYRQRRPPTRPRHRSQIQLPRPPKKLLMEVRHISIDCRPSLSHPLSCQYYLIIFLVIPYICLFHIFSSFFYYTTSKWHLDLQGLDPS